MGATLWPSAFARTTSSLGRNVTSATSRSTTAAAFELSYRRSKTVFSRNLFPPFSRSPSSVLEREREREREGERKNVKDVSLRKSALRKGFAYIGISKQVFFKVQTALTRAATKFL